MTRSAAGSISGAAKTWPDIGGIDKDVLGPGVTITSMDDGTVHREYAEDHVSSDLDGWVHARDVPGLKLNPTKSKRQWAKQEVVAALESVAKEWHKRHPDLPIRIGEISKQGGGELPPHKSHQKGGDVDVGVMPVYSDGKKPAYGNADYSRDLTQELIDVFRDYSTLEIRMIIFADPEVAGTAIRSDHAKHFHVRFASP